MKSSVAVAGAVALLAISPASAADMPVKAPPLAVPQYSWSGFYIGAHAGYLWGRTRLATDTTVIEEAAPTNGFVGGALAGWRWQSDRIVFGIEGDIGWTNAHGTGLAVPTVTTVTYTYDFRWTAQVRGQLGYAFDRLLVFVAGGLAIADFKLQRFSTTVVQLGNTFTGGTIGGGIEYAFTPVVSGRLEYLYDHFGNKTYSISTFPYHVRLTGSTFRGALNVRLWNP
jgi:outer membrane immunogenic protein